MHTETMPCFSLLHTISESMFFSDFVFSVEKVLFLKLATMKF